MLVAEIKLMYIMTYLDIQRESWNPLLLTN